MKKLMSLILAGIAVIALNGCGDGDDYYPDDLTTLFLVDEGGYSYAGIPYICESMRDWDTTRPNGEFSFYPGEDCEFDFSGLYGTDPNDFTVPYNELIYIVDYVDENIGLVIFLKRPQNPISAVSMQKL